MRYGVGQTIFTTKPNQQAVQGFPVNRSYTKAEADNKFALKGAGGGITSINTDATVAQTLTTGTTGTDFAIVDNGSGDHKFNIPSSSAVNRGLLTSTDWSTFNSKITSSAVGVVEQWGGNDINTGIGNNTYTLFLYAEYGMTINELKIISGSGTCTAAVKIGSTAVTGISAVSVSSSIATGTASAANTVAAGDKVTLVLSSTSSLNNLQWTLKTTRT